MDFGYLFNNIFFSIQFQFPLVYHYTSVMAIDHIMKATNMITVDEYLGQLWIVLPLLGWAVIMVVTQTVIILLTNCP